MSDPSDSTDRGTVESPPKKRSITIVLVIVFCVFLFCGGVAALLVPARECAREAARRMQCTSNMKQLGLGMHLFHDANEHFPGYDDPDHAEYEPCSWRVQMLPYIEEGQLYERYDRTQSWNATTNMALGKKIVSTYRCPSNPNDSITDTDILSVVGPNCVFRDKGSTKSADITDGASNTIMFVESADSGIHWMEPRDLKFEDARIVKMDSKGPGIRSHHPGVVNVTFCDGSIRSISQAIDPKLLKALMTIDGGEVIERFND